MLICLIVDCSFVKKLLQINKKIITIKKAQEQNDYTIKQKTITQ